MENEQKSRIHPLAAAAAVAVIVASAVGVAAMTGHLPGSNAESAAAPQISAAPAPVAAVRTESAEHRAVERERERVRNQHLADASQSRAQSKVTTTTHYEVLVRLENGSSQTVFYPTQPAFSVGSRVRVENGTLVLI